MQQAADLATVACRRNRCLDSHRQAVERTADASGVFERAGLLTHPLGIEINQRTQLRIQAFDLLDVFPGQLQRRDLPPPQHGKKLHRGHYSEAVHCVVST